MASDSKPFVVNCVCAYTYIPITGPYFLIEWKGYPEKTWEPVCNLDGCAKLLTACVETKRCSHCQFDGRRFPISYLNVWDFLYMGGGGGMLSLTYSNGPTESFFIWRDPDCPCCFLLKDEHGVCHARVSVYHTERELTLESLDGKSRPIESLHLANWKDQSHLFPFPGTPRHFV